MVTIDRQPSSRKTIIPWYDSEIVCLVMIILMSLVFMFGHIGLNLARVTPAYQNHSWIVTVLMASSGGIIFSTTVRLVRRYLSRKYP